jgi:hypothetical protein
MTTARLLLLTEAGVRMAHICIDYAIVKGATHYAPTAIVKGRSTYRSLIVIISA